MEYIFESSQHSTEFERLKLIEDAFDETTKGLIGNSGITQGWKCLEVGPGSGSILRWMAELVGRGGKVVGIDKNTEYINNVDSEQVELIEDDILDVDLGTNIFDIVTARYVFIHISDAEKIINKLIKFLKPNGVLLLQEPDFTVARVPCQKSLTEQAHQRVNEAINQMFLNLDLDPSFGTKLPLVFQNNNVSIEQVVGDCHLCCGQSKVARMMAYSAYTLREKYISTQKASEQDVERYIENSSNQKFWAVYYATISVVGKKLPQLIG